ncbi:MAG: 6-phosphofructokinase, partial [Clostridia bacterium]|nr:6-phosphofructokinase [Clostridia bacterium]
MRIGILTSGGDAPGMNACVKSVCDMASNLGYELIAFKRGYKGVIDMDYLVLDR